MHTNNIQYVGTCSGTSRESTCHSIDNVRGIHQAKNINSITICFSTNKQQGSLKKTTQTMHYEGNPSNITIDLYSLIPATWVPIFSGPKQTWGDSWAKSCPAKTWCFLFHQQQEPIWKAHIMTMGYFHLDMNFDTFAKTMILKNMK